MGFESYCLGCLSTITQDIVAVNSLVSQVRKCPDFWNNPLFCIKSPYGQFHRGGIWMMPPNRTLIESMRYWLYPLGNLLRRIVDGHELSVSAYRLFLPEGRFQS
jgi:hypothetical protein